MQLSLVNKNRIKSLESEIIEDDVFGLVFKCKLIIAVSQKEVWNSITIEKKLLSWAAPEVHVELKIGGPYELYFFPNNSTGSRGLEGSRITCLVPFRMLAYSLKRPENQMIWVIDSDEHTKTRVSVYGVSEDKYWEQEIKNYKSFAERMMVKLFYHLTGKKKINE